jgi:leucyl-tRNA synthetase
MIGNATELYNEPWPKYDEGKTVSDKMTVAIQINGKLRDTIEVDRSIGEDEIKKTAVERPNIARWLEGKTPKKVIYVQGKIISIVL